MTILIAKATRWVDGVKVRRNRTTAHPDARIVADHPELWRPVPVDHPAPAAAPVPAPAPARARAKAAKKAAPAKGG